jgi:hypothetical protein
VITKAGLSVLVIVYICLFGGSGLEVHT